MESYRTVCLPMKPTSALSSTGSHWEDGAIAEGGYSDFRSLSSKLQGMTSCTSLSFKAIIVGLEDVPQGQSSCLAQARALD